ncbi:MAG: Ig-like domain-containing protein [Erysipelotrichales bacterium]|nr:Ig-like domain-containing protein [Erysipelotrichales bacterium]
MKTSKKLLLFFALTLLTCASCSNSNKNSNTSSDSTSNENSASNSQNSGPEIPEELPWNLITDEAELHAGDVIVIASGKDSVTAGEIGFENNTQYLVAENSTFASDKKQITSLSSGTIQFTLGEEDGVWTLANENGELLGATSARELAWDSGSTTWEISIASDGNATIKNTNSSFGTLYYNSIKSNFRPFTSVQTYPQIYRGKIGDPIYATSIEIIGNTKVLVGYETQLSVKFTPYNTNRKVVTWESSDTSVATISDTGKVTAIKQGTSTITATVIGENDVLVQKSIILTVENVPISSLTLNKTSLDLVINQTYKLTASILPDDATNKNIIWNSSNPSVATVTDGIVEAISSGTSTITASSEDGTKVASCNVEVKNQLLDDYTIMIYLSGTDLETDAGLATENIAEILSVDNMPDNINIIIQTGGAKKWSTKYGISSTTLQRWHVKNNNLVMDDELPNASMGASSTFQSFMEWGLTEYPASKTGVILWGHGGAVVGCCYDETYDYDQLTSGEAHYALEKAFEEAGITNKLEWIGYDCCLMATADVADLSSDYFEYMVASQESEPGEGWDYDNWLDDLYANTEIETPDLLKEIANTYVEKCDAYYKSWGYSNYNDATMSVLDLSKMPIFREAWENMSLNLSKIIISTSKWSKFKSYVNGCQKFGYDSSYGYPYDVFDIKDFIEAMKESEDFSSIGIEDVETALEEVVIHNVYGKNSADAGGLNFFCAISGYGSRSSYLASETYFDNWRELNSTYGSWYRY